MKLTEYRKRNRPSEAIHRLGKSFLNGLLLTRFNKITATQLYTRLNVILVFLMIFVIFLQEKNV